ncbi:MAG: TIM barrel protein [Desulfovibrio sp.]|nr:TIM barrel protein [Desulfovibrio sp.]MCA1985394.1 TIM barrel protein [Desulfovibrio sp.]
MAVYFSFPLRLVDAEPHWPQEFAARARTLAEALGRELHVGPEFTFDCTTLQSRPAAWFTSLGRTLRRAGLPCTVHLPFWDLHPASLDDNILRATRKTLALAVDRALRLQPAHLVGHISFLRYVHQPEYPRFLDRSEATWRPLAARLTPELPLLLENTHDESPQVLADVLARLEGANAGVCFDVGHWSCFNGGLDKKDLPHWLDVLGPWIRACHVHDNDGTGDQHLAPGHGSIPFGQFFAGLVRRNIAPTIVLEAHGPDAVQGAMQFLACAHGPWRDVL